MAIAYPLALPTVTGIASVDFTATNVGAQDRSPFTMAGGVQVYDGQLLKASLRIPPTRNREIAETWIAFLLSLRGIKGTFLLGDPNRPTLLGNAISCSVTGAVAASTVSATVPPGQTLFAGDYIQLGGGAGARLHKVLVDYVGTGAPTDLEIWPALRVAVTDQAAVLSDCVGVFRLDSINTSWSINSASAYGISFDAVEVV